MTLRNDLSLYARPASEWWDPEGPAFRSLHAVNRFRFARLRSLVPTSLEERRVVDLGCGGGLLSLPLLAEGARVVGVDRSPECIDAARQECARGGLAARARWIVGDAARTPLETERADLVLLSDVLEHVPSPAGLLREASRLLRPGGLLYASTLNRTWRASFLAVHLAEGLRLVPRGTHDPRLFVPPARLATMAREVGLDPVVFCGEGVRLWATLRRWRVEPRPSRSLAVAYSVLLRRRPSAPPRSPSRSHACAV